MTGNSRGRSIAIGLWACVFIAGYYVFFMQPRLNRNANQLNGAVSTSDPNAMVSSSGAVFVTVPWKSLPDVERFQLTDQTGANFDSADLNGHVYAVSFFFSSCPTICRDLNRQLQQLGEQLRDVDVQLLTITVDPDVDTPEVLGRYAQDFGAVPERWRFLTGAMHRIKQLGEHSFRVIIDKAEHTDKIHIVDKWGRFRDRFQWNDPDDMKRCAVVVRELAAETKPPLDAEIVTRNAMAGIEPVDWDSVPWIREFYVIDQNGKKFSSRDLTGEVWLGSFFFSTCPGVCIKQNQYLSALQDRLGNRKLKIVSITTDPQKDTPAVLTDYAQQLHALPDQWLFCSANEKLTRRIAAEFFKASVGGDHHTSRLFVVDRWGQVRGSFDWQQPDHEAQLLALVDQCSTELSPVAKFNRIDP